MIRVIAFAAVVLAACGGPALAVPAPLPPAAGRLLVARAGLPDPNFERTVVLLVDKGEAGAWGLIVNRPTALEVGRVFPGAAAFRGRADVLHFGGPVEGWRIFALVRAAARGEDLRPVLPGVRLSWRIETIDRLAGEGAPCRVFAGYAGWGAGQLEAEIARGDWQVLEADEAVLFESNGVLMWELLSRKTATIVVERSSAAAARRTGA